MEGKSWQVMHMNVMKGFSAAQSNEHQRNWTERGWDFALKKGRYDRQRERLNFEVVKGGKIQEIDKRQSIPERMAESLLQRGIKDPNEGLAEPKYRTVVDFILSGSQTTIRQLAFGNQDVVYEPGNILENATLKRMPEIEQWAKDMYRFMSERFGEENIIGCYVHLDELSPHMHLTLLPIQDGKFAFKKIFAGKDKLEFSARTKKLHDELAEVNRKWNLKRGRNVSETGAKHRTTEEYRRHLSEECTNIEEQVVQHKKALSDLKVEISLAERRVKGLTSMVDNLRKAKAEKEYQLSALERTLQSHQGDTAAIIAERDRLEKKLASIQTKLEDKQDKLRTADQQLEALKRDMDAIGERTEELKSEAYKYSREIHSNVDVLLKDVMLETLVREHSARLGEMGLSEQSRFDGSLLQSLTEQGSEVMHCATLLFLGMVNDATTFAETHGGGGSSSDLKWGRDDAEDNRAWARRCMMMASKMMRPTSGKKQKR